MNRLDMTGTGDQIPGPIREQEGAQREMSVNLASFNFNSLVLLVAAQSGSAAMCSGLHTLMVGVTRLRPHSDSQSKYANKSVQICLQSALAN